MSTNELVEAKLIQDLQFDNIRGNRHIIVMVLFLDRSTKDV